MSKNSQCNKEVKKKPTKAMKDKQAAKKSKKESKAFLGMFGNGESFRADKTSGLRGVSHSNL